MNPYFHYYFMIPLAGFLADAALLFVLFKNRSRKNYFWPFVLLYATVALWNLKVIRLFSVDTEQQAKIALYIIHHFIPFMPVCFLLICLYLTGRRANAIYHVAVLWTLAIVSIVEYSFWLTPGDTLFIQGVRRFNWGYYPLVGFGAVAFSLCTLYCVAFGFYYLTFPRLQSPLLKKLRMIFLFFWLGLASSHLPVFGVNFIPLGNVTDAIISVFLAQVMFERENLGVTAQRSMRIAGAMAAVALALIFSWLVTEFVVELGRATSAVLTIVAALVSVIYFQRFFGPLRSKIGDLEVRADSLFSLLQVKYLMTYQEATLCSFLAAGESREAIRAAMNIAPNTMKVHLSSIYRKTIGKEIMLPSRSKEKLQRLTVFLHDIEKKIRQSNT